MPVKSNVQLKTLGYVIVYVKDTAKALPFYTEKLGMTVKSNEDGWVELEAGQTTFALHGNKEFKPAAEGSQTTPAFNVDDFNGTYEALKQDGVKFLHEPMQVCEAGPGKVGMSAEFKDTDGNNLSIFGLVSK